MWSPKTLSFWLATLGTISIAHPKTRNTGITLLMAVGWGGAGGTYYRACLRENVPTQPLAVWPHMTPDDWHGLLQHAVFIVPACVALKLPR